MIKEQNMRKKIISTIGMMMVLFVCVGFSGNATAAEAAKSEAPIVKLSYVEVAHYWGWWYYKKEVEPTKGTKGDYGAPLDLAFIFEIENPNSFPVKLDEFKFTVAFEEFDVNTINATESQWIPAGKSNQLRVHSVIDGRQTLLSLMVTGGFKLKEKGISAFEQLEKWWTAVPEFSFPIHVKEGAAVFSSDKGAQVVPFTASYPE